MDLSKIDLSILDEAPRQAAIAVEGTKPDDAAAAMALSKQTGVPAGVINLDVPTFTQQTQTQRNADILSRNSALGNYVRNPLDAQVSGDDFEHLNKVSDTINRTWGSRGNKPTYSLNPIDTKEFAKGYNAGRLQTPLADAAAPGFLGLDFDEGKAAALSQQIKENESHGASGWIGEILGGFAGSAADATAGAATGAAYGAVAGGPVGAAAGMGAGAVGGFAYNAGKTAAVNNWYNRRNDRDENGRPIDPLALRLGSVFYGLTVGAVNMYQGKAAAEAAGAVSNLIAGATTRLTRDPAFGQLVSKLSKEVGESGVTAAALGAVQAGANTLQDTLVSLFSGDYKTVLNDPVKRQEAIDQAYVSVRDTVLMMTGPKAFAVGTNIVADRMHMEQAPLSAKGVLEAHKEMQSSQTFMRAPEAAYRFAAEHGGEVGLPPERAMELYEKIKDADLHPDAATAVQKIPQLALQATVHGGDVKIPLATYLVYVPEDMAKGMIDDTRVGDGITVNEAKDLKETPPDYNEVPKDPGLMVPQIEADAILDADGKITPDAELAQAANAARQESIIGEAAKQAERETLTEDGVGALTKIDQETEAQRKALYLTDLFKDAKAAGMTVGEFNRYQRELQIRDNELFEKNFERAKREEKRRQTKDWKENYARIEEDVTLDISKQPAWFADSYFRKGEIPGIEREPGQEKLSTVGKLSKEEVDRMFGNYAGDFRPTSDDLPPSYFSKDAIPADELADTFGFGSGQEMILELAAAEQARREAGLTPEQGFKEAVKAETTRRMEAQYGELDKNIQEAARAQAMSEKQLDVMTTELQILADKVGELPMTRAAMEAEVRASVDNLTVAEIRNGKTFERNANKYGRQAEFGFAGGDGLKAFKAKQLQLINTMIFKETQKLNKQIEKLDKTLEKYQDNLTVGNYPQRYTDQIQRFINNYLGMKTFRSMDELNRTNPTTLWEFVQDEYNQNTNQIDPPSFISDADWMMRNDKSMDNLTGEQFRELNDFITQMEHHAKAEGKITVAGKKADFEAAMKSAIEGMQKQPLQKGDPGRGKMGETLVGETARVWTTALDATLIRMDRLLGWADNRDINGVINRAVVRPLREAQGFAGDLTTKIGKRFRELPKVENPRQRIMNMMFLDTNGKPFRFTKLNLIAAALNLGSESNFRVMTKGYGWDPVAFERFVADNLTKKDWEFVQGVWKILDEDMFPELDKASIRDNGVGLNKIEGREITLADGTVIKGGYYPLVVDKNKAAAREVDQVTVDTNKRFMPLPTRNYEKQRTGKVYPISFELGRLNGEVGMQIHNASYREAVKQASKFLTDPRFLTQIADTFGENYRDQIRPWLEHIASNGGEYHDSAFQNIVAGSRFMRENMMTMLIGLKPSTALIHGGAALINSMKEVGSRELFNASMDMIFRNPTQFDSYREQAYAESAHLRNRRHNLDRDLRKMINSAQFGATFAGKSTFLRARAAQFSLGLVAMLDQASALPTYHAVKTRALKNGMSFEDAVAAGEDAVIRAHGSNGLVDLPAFLRGPEAMKWMTTFGGFWNHSYNQTRDGARLAQEVYKEGGNPLKGMTAASAVLFGTAMGYLIPQAVWHSVVRPHGPGEGKEEELSAASVGKYIGGAVGRQMISMLPMGGSAVFAYDTDRGFEAAGTLSTAVQSIFIKPLKAAKSADKDISIRETLDAIGFLTGAPLVTRTTNRAAQYIWDLNTGKARAPMNFEEWQRLVLDAYSPPKKRPKQ